MNKRIQKIAEQAGAEIYGHPDYATICVNGKDADDLMKKFAELIVKKTLDEVALRAFVSGDRAWSDEADRKWIELEFGLGELAKVAK